MIAEAMKIHQDDVGHIPLHQQALAWATKKNVDLVQLADNYMFAEVGHGQVIDGGGLA